MQGAGGGRAVVVVADRELRTPKYLFALSLGRPVVTFAHLDACVASKVRCSARSGHMTFTALTYMPLRVRGVVGWI